MTVSADSAAASPRTPTDPHLATWRTFLVSHALLNRRLDEELRSAHGMSLAEYDALLQIARAPGRRLRMNRIADQVLLSRSGVTRLVDRLVNDGLVDRRSCSTDARGAEAVLTDAGLAAIRAASPTHLAGVQRYFLDVIDPADLETMRRNLGSVADRLGIPAGCEIDPAPVD